MKVYMYVHIKTEILLHKSYTNYTKSQLLLLTLLSSKLFIVFNPARSWIFQRCDLILSKCIHKAILLYPICVCNYFQSIKRGRGVSLNIGYLHFNLFCCTVISKLEFKETE